MEEEQGMEGQSRPQIFNISQDDNQLAQYQKPDCGADILQFQSFNDTQSGTPVQPMPSHIGTLYKIGDATPRQLS
eukprot:6380038-Amphidinium_carterae.3